MGLRQSMLLLWGWGLAQGLSSIGEWKVYEDFGVISRIEYLPPYFWCLGQKGIALVHSEQGSYRELTQVSGLLPAVPTAIYADPYSGWIFIGYADGHIQYGPSPENLTTLRDVAVNTFYSSRVIRDFYARGDTLVVATDFGLVLWSKKRRQVIATIPRIGNAPFGEPVYHVRWTQGYLWAYTRSGLYAIREGGNWLTGWQKFSGSSNMPPDNPLRFRGWGETPLGFLLATDSALYRWEGQSWVSYTLPAGYPQAPIVRLAGEGAVWGAAFRDSSAVYFFSASGVIRSMWGIVVTWIYVNGAGTHFGVATQGVGAYVSTPSRSTSTEPYRILRSPRPTEVIPTLHGIYFLHLGWTPWGAAWSSNVTFYDFAKKSSQLIQLSSLVGRSIFWLGQGVWDGQSAWIPSSSAVFRLSPQGRIDTFTQHNLPFDGILPDATGKPTLMAFSCIVHDVRQGTIWVAKRYGNNNLWIYRISSGEWLPPLSVAGEILSMCIDTRGYKWLLLRNGTLLVIDDRGRPESSASHRRITLGPSGVSLPNLPGSTIQAVAPDKSGAIWIGTDRGVAVLYGDPFSGNLSVNVPVIENRYLLEEENITCIAIDGQNRKWIGTQNNGVYVLSPDGTRQIASFNSSNSPLQSNFIYNIRPWDLTGEIFIINSEGVVSYRDWSTGTAEKLDTLHIFPNPVPRSFEGWVGIRGLTEGATVRIFTPEGKLVRYLRGFGGQAVWDLRTVEGEKVSPGVYIISAIDSENQRSAVGKIIVVE
ncbi:MAG: hypothetical protein NZ580_00925 [Bacteroidia bacterium]|nr:hypothetical protein [Bacteroidia bacterium]MDW8235258.1 two-component regulator propeller domain-containing protein [Bacteroidia bacterium]